MRAKIKGKKYRWLTKFFQIYSHAICRYNRAFRAETTVDAFCFGEQNQSRAIIFG
jgi:hypothetical protein